MIAPTIQRQREQIGANVRVRRDAADLSQGELAERVRSQQGVISAIECGRRDVNARLLARLSLALKCNAGDLLEGVA